MRLRSVELEAFVKSFLLFFLSISFLSSLLFYSIYKKESENLDREIFSQMRACSFDLKCSKFEIGFSKSGKSDLYTLKHEENGLYALFPINDSSKYLLKIIYPYENYQADLKRVEREILKEFMIAIMVIAFLSVLFSLYAINPLRRALKLTEEFVRDILHDFNTPLSVIRLNARLLKNESENSKKSTRIEEAVETLLRLQSNLRSYLGGEKMVSEPFRLDELLRERVEFMERAYLQIHFLLKLEPMRVKCSRDAMIRIVDNVVGNAAKYNVDGGRVEIVLNANKATLAVIDTGIGIENPRKIFDRFYKEHDRGMGIGLHIVKKLCDEMGIEIAVESEKGKGSSFLFDLKKVTLR